VTTSSEWMFKAHLPLVSCGIDSEHVRRFVQWENDTSDFLPFVFTKRERRHCRGSAEALCASFCIKEAFFKALGKPYNFTDCEFLYSPDPTKARLQIGGDLAKTGLLPAGRILSLAYGQLTAAMYLFKAS
jgi:phosphopantetheinyl transferase (holo-ACP synthase)